MIPTTTRKRRIPTKWCPYCAADVEVIVMLEKGDEITHCTLCNRAIPPDTQAGERRAPPAAVKPAALQADSELTADDWDRLLSDDRGKQGSISSELENAFVEPEPAELAQEHERGFLDTVLVADDSPTIRAHIEDIFRDRGFAREVICFENGREAIQGYVQIKEAGGQIGLLVLDLEMPVMNGLLAASTIRQIEKQRKYEPVTILFFSGRKRDERLDTALQRMKPAMYINKGDTDQKALRGRLTRIVDLLRQELELPQ